MENTLSFWLDKYVEFILFNNHLEQDVDVTASQRRLNEKKIHPKHVYYPTHVRTEDELVKPHPIKQTLFVEAFRYKREVLNIFG